MLLYSYSFKGSDVDFVLQAIIVDKKELTTTIFKNKKCRIDMLFDKIEQKIVTKEMLRNSLE